MSIVEELAAGIEGSTELLLRYLAGFDDANAAAQADHLPNHAAWILGHLALTMHRAAEKIADQTIPLGYDPEPFAFGSTPSPRRADYPPLASLIDRYKASHALLARAIRESGEAGLRRQINWGGRFTVTGRDLVLRMLFHNGTHCGQLIDLRRALGLPSVFAGR
jgi:hypothetical protein